MTRTPSSKSHAIKERKVAHLGFVFRHNRDDVLPLKIMRTVVGRRDARCRRKTQLRNIRERTGIVSALQQSSIAVNWDK